MKQTLSPTSEKKYKNQDIEQKTQMNRRSGRRRIIQENVSSAAEERVWETVNALDRMFCHGRGRKLLGV